MGLDYYGVLNLKKNCTDLEIKKAYRRLSLLYNPQRQEDDYLRPFFILIAEAYEVLSNKYHRAIYDQYAEEGLKNGVPGPHEFIQPYVFHGDPLRTYREFYGTESPYADLLDYLENPLPIFSTTRGKGYKSKDAPIIRPLHLTLEEVFFGGIKKIKIQKRVLIGDDKINTTVEEKIIKIDIKPGIPQGTELTFPEEGDESPTTIPADIIFVVKDREHKRYVRDDINLIMTVNITLQQALTGFQLNIITLEKKKLLIPITNIVRPNWEKVIVNEGMPKFNEITTKGNIILKFNIAFPHYLPNPCKDLINKAFELAKEDGGPDQPERINRLIQKDKQRSITQGERKLSITKIIPNSYNQNVTLM